MIKLTLNGKDHEFDAPGEMPLLWALRDVALLTGTKYGCVHVDGQPTRSCVTPLASVAGKKITTIEAVAEQPAGKAVQEAWRKLDVVQCGYCQSGQIMQAAALLTTNKKPTREQIVTHMDGNLCRCGTYPRIVRAIQRAAREA